jgi:hypothetical protein
MTPERLADAQAYVAERISLIAQTMQVTRYYRQLLQRELTDWQRLGALLAGQPPAKGKGPMQAHTPHT